MQPIKVKAKGYSGTALTGQRPLSFTGDLVMILPCGLRGMVVSDQDGKIRNCELAMLTAIQPSPAKLE